MFPRGVVFPFTLASLLILGACSGGSSGKNASETTTAPRPAQMRVSPTALQTSVTIGNVGALSFSVQNTGGAPLAFQATSGDSWISGLENLGSVEVNPGGANTVNLQLQCTTPGQLTGSISVTGNDANNPSDTISVDVQCTAPVIQIQIDEVPGRSNGTPGIDAQGSLSWSISSSWPQQPDVDYTLSSNDTGVILSNPTGSIGLTGQVRNNLSYACPSVASPTPTITISVAGSRASTTWQIQCVAALEGNVTFDRAELYQGPLAAIIDANLAVTGFVDAIAGRQALLALQLGHDSSTVPEFTLNIIEPAQTTALAPVLMSVQAPAQSGTGRWASLYAVNVAASLMQTGNNLEATMDPNNQIAETNEADNGLTFSLNALGLKVMPEFKPVFVPIDAEGRVPANVNSADLLEATLDLLPIADYTASVRNTYSYTGGTWDWQTALNEIHALWNAEAADDEFYHGLYRQPNNFNGGTTGIGFIGLPVSISASLDSPLGSDQTVAHEFGHNIGLNHAPGGCNESNVDPNYPHAFGGIGPNGGWLFSEARYIAPESGYFDLMTYCHPQYISDYHYQSVIDVYVTGQMASGQSVFGVTSGSIALAGSVDEYGVWSLTQAVTSDKSARRARPGPFTIILYGADGIEIYRQSFDCYYTDHKNFAIWAVRVPEPSVAVAAVRVWDLAGNLLLDENVAP